MEPSVKTGKSDGQQQGLLDFDLRRKIHANFDWEKHWTASRYFETGGFERLVEAITKGDGALKAEVLRRWRIR